MPIQVQSPPLPRLIQVSLPSATLVAQAPGPLDLYNHEDPLSPTQNWRVWPAQTFLGGPCCPFQFARHSGHKLRPSLPGEGLEICRRMMQDTPIKVYNEIILGGQGGGVTAIPVKICHSLSSCNQFAHAGCNTCDAVRAAAFLIGYVSSAAPAAS